MAIDNERVGLALDRLDNLAAALSLPLPASIHVDALRNSLPEVAAELRAALELPEWS